MPPASSLITGCSLGPLSLLCEQVFASTGLEIVTQTRVEHLPETEKSKQHSINPLQDFLGAAQDQAGATPSIEATPKTTTSTSASSMEEPVQPLLTLEEYFTKPFIKEDYDGEQRGVRSQCTLNQRSPWSGMHLESATPI